MRANPMILMDIGANIPDEFKAIKVDLTEFITLRYIKLNHGINFERGILLSLN